jgi:hypothetical protein
VGLRVDGGTLEDHGKLEQPEAHRYEARHEGSAGGQMERRRGARECEQTAL